MPVSGAPYVGEGTYTIPVTIIRPTPRNTDTAHIAIIKD